MNINKISKNYAQQQLLLTVGISLIALLVMQVWHLDIIIPLMVSVVFNLVTGYAIAHVWKSVASKSPDNLTTFYTAVSGGRLLLALMVMLVFYLVSKSGTMLTFFLVFMVFYIAALAHHSVFFARVSNRM